MCIVSILMVSFNVFKWFSTVAISVLTVSVCACRLFFMVVVRVVSERHKSILWHWQPFIPYRFEVQCLFFLEAKMEHFCIRIEVA